MSICPCGAFGFIHRLILSVTSRVSHTHNIILFLNGPTSQSLRPTYHVLSSCQISGTMTAYKVASTPAPISNHERAHHKTASTSIQIMLMMKPDRLTEEEAGGSDK